MPELPEVETVRRDLAGVAIGSTFASVAVTGARSVRRHAPSLLQERLAQRTIIGVRRHGKYLLIDLDDTNVVVVHLRMSGQLLWTPRDAPLAKHTHVRFTFAIGEHELRFVDPRTFGEVWWSPPSLPTMDHIGPDAWLDLPTPESLFSRCTGRRSAIKALLLNQEILAGIGNIYSDELLWRARIRYSRTPDRLTRPAWARLHAAMKEVLGEAIEARGSSLSDAQYVDLYGRVGAAQRRHDVYAREHEPCGRCGAPIRRRSFGGRSTFFCAHCQR